MRTNTSKIRTPDEAHHYIETYIERRRSDDGLTASEARTHLRLAVDLAILVAADDSVGRAVLLLDEALGRGPATFTPDDKDDDHA